MTQKDYVVIASVLRTLWLVKGNSLIELCESHSIVEIES